MTTKPPTCEGCPYATRGRGYVPGRGPTNARWVIIGQGPGANEVALGYPFVDAPGRAGARLTRQLEWASLNREEAWVDNVVRCLIQTGKDKSDAAPQRAVAECWQRHLGPTLHALEAKATERGEPLWVLWVGLPAMKQGMGPWANLGTTGSLVTTTLPPYDSPALTKVEASQEGERDGSSEAVP